MSQCVVVVADEQSVVVIDADRWRSLAMAAGHHLGLSGELTLSFIDVDEMTTLNAEFMDAAGPTDVLAFPLDAADGLDDTVTAARPPDQPVLLGDIVICPEVARDQAVDHAGTFDDELALLVVHGLLHLIGHDHARRDEAAAMRDAERDLLERFHWMGPAPVGFSFDHR